MAAEPPDPWAFLTKSHRRGPPTTDNDSKTSTKTSLKPSTSTKTATSKPIQGSGRVAPVFAAANSSIPSSTSTTSTIPSTRNTLRRIDITRHATYAPLPDHSTIHVGYIQPIPSTTLTSKSKTSTTSTTSTASTTSTTTTTTNKDNTTVCTHTLVADHKGKQPIGADTDLLDVLHSIQLSPRTAWNALCSSNIANRGLEMHTAPFANLARRVVAHTLIPSKSNLSNDSTTLDVDHILDAVVAGSINTDVFQHLCSMLELWKSSANVDAFLARNASLLGTKQRKRNTANNNNSADNDSTADSDIADESGVSSNAFLKLFAAQELGPNAISDDDIFHFGDTDSEDEAIKGDISTLELTAMRHVVLVGPLGAGVTSLLYKAARKCGYDVLELNGSQSRTGKQVLASLVEATQSNAVGRGTRVLTVKERDSKLRSMLERGSKSPVPSHDSSISESRTTRQSSKKTRKPISIEDDGEDDDVVEVSSTRVSGRNVRQKTEQKSKTTNVPISTVTKNKTSSTTAKKTKSSSTSQQSILSSFGVVVSKRENRQQNDDKPNTKKESELLDNSDSKKKNVIPKVPITIASESNTNMEVEVVSDVDTTTNKTKYLVFGTLTSNLQHISHSDPRNGCASTDCRQDTSLDMIAKRKRSEIEQNIEDSDKSDTKCSPTQSDVSKSCDSYSLLTSELYTRDISMSVLDSSGNARSMKKQLQTGKRTVILLDESDILSYSDRGYWSAVRDLLLKSKRPIILTANRACVSPLTPTEREAMMVEKYLARPSEEQVTQLVRLILLRQHIWVPTSRLNEFREFCRRSGGDIRKLLHSMTTIGLAAQRALRTVGKENKNVITTNQDSDLISRSSMSGSHSNNSGRSSPIESIVECEDVDVEKEGEEDDTDDPEWNNKQTRVFLWDPKLCCDLDGNNGYSWPSVNDVLLKPNDIINKSILKRRWDMVAPSTINGSISSVCSSWTSMLANHEKLINKTKTLVEGQPIIIDDEDNNENNGQQSLDNSAESLITLRRWAQFADQISSLVTVPEHILTLESDIFLSPTSGVVRWKSDSIDLSLDSTSTTQSITKPDTSLTRTSSETSLLTLDGFVEIKRNDNTATNAQNANISNTSNNNATTNSIPGLSASQLMKMDDDNVFSDDCQFVDELCGYSPSNPLFPNTMKSGPPTLGPIPLSIASWRQSVLPPIDKVHEVLRSSLFTGKVPLDCNGSLVIPRQESSNEVILGSELWNTMSITPITETISLETRRERTLMNIDRPFSRNFSTMNSLWVSPGNLHHDDIQRVVEIWGWLANSITKQLDLASIADIRALQLIRTKQQRAYHKDYDADSNVNDDDVVVNPFAVFGSCSKVTLDAGVQSRFDSIVGCPLNALGSLKKGASTVVVGAALSTMATLRSDSDTILVSPHSLFGTRRWVIDVAPYIEQLCYSDRNPEEADWFKRSHLAIREELEAQATDNMRQITGRLTNSIGLVEQHNKNSVVAEDAEMAIEMFEMETTLSRRQGRRRGGGRRRKYRRWLANVLTEQSAARLATRWQSYYSNVV